MSASALQDVLHIPAHQQRPLSSTRTVCLVHNDWLNGLQNNIIQDDSRTKLLDKDLAALYLSPSNNSLPANWSRVCVKVVLKTDQKCNRWHHGSIYSSGSETSCMAHLTLTARDNYRNHWTEAQLKHGTKHQQKYHTPCDQISTVPKVCLSYLRPQVYLQLVDKQHDQLDNDQRVRSYSGQGASDQCNNVIPTLALIETQSVFVIIQPYIPLTLLDIVSYSPAVFGSSHAKSLFVLYQILHALAEFHSNGVPAGKLTLDRVRVDDKLWVYCTQSMSVCLDLLSNPIEKSSSSFVSAPANDSQPSQEDRNRSSQNSFSSNSDTGSSVDSFARQLSMSFGNGHMTDAMDVIENYQGLDFRSTPLVQITEDWIHHRITNFRYLMYLNHLAGRRLGDPNHHPVLPWVMDFTSPHEGLRDLSVSKFRINKGESQLDFTYEGMIGFGDDLDHIPHHVSDVLSDITYYVYKARKTPKQLLCRYVRSKWVPNEYPQSVERMYQWTPDECIPELFTDPSIFTSMHEDLPDLEVPYWCASAAEFIEKHNAVLESDQVSCKLHDWIDLTFGYKLTGSSAVKAKNVYLHLVDNHKTLQNHGVVQLFTHPHPHRLSLDKTRYVSPLMLSQTILSREPGESVEKVRIELPADFDPMATLDHFEALHTFTSKTLDCLPPSTTKSKEDRGQFAWLDEGHRGDWLDMQQFGCFVCELFLPTNQQALTPFSSLRERYNLIGRLCAKDKHLLPRMVHMAADILLNLANFSEVAPSDHEGPSHLPFLYPTINELGLPPPTPAMLLQKCCSILPFPTYFRSLYNVISDMKDIDKDIVKETSQIKSSRERLHIEKTLSRKKVELLEEYLRQNSGQISEEGIELLLPYIKDLFKDPRTSVQAAWSILHPVGKELGPAELAKNLMPYLTHLFNGDETTPKHMKLYHRTFLVPLCLSIGLRKFLENFCTLLVEAVAGYKDFVVTNTNVMEEELELEGDTQEEVFTTSYHHHHGNRSHGESLEDVTEEDEACENENGNCDTQQTGLDDIVEDIRPDQNEEDSNIDRSDADDDDEEDDGEGLDEVDMAWTDRSRSRDSNSDDKGSSLSTESDPAVHDDSVSHHDQGSSDQASIHSISHIIGASKDNSEADDTSSYTTADDSQPLQFEGDTDENMDVTDSKNNNNKNTSSGNKRNQSSNAIHRQNQQKRVRDYGQGNQSNNANDECTDDSVNDHSGSFMIRSETDEFQQICHSHTINISVVAAESIKWFSHRLGPLLTAKYLSKNLVRMLGLCYLGEEQIVHLTKNDGTLPESTRLVEGDRNAHKVLECLSYVACLYGEQVILLQYIPCIIDMIDVGRKRQTVRAEAGLVAAVVLLRHMVPLLGNNTFLETLHECLIKDALRPLLKLVSSATASFSSGATVRSLILYKVIDVLYIIGLRLGFELTRKLMTGTLKAFFKPFEQVYYAGGAQNTDTKDGSPNNDTGSMDESFLNIRIDNVTKQYTIGSPVSLSVSPNPADHLKKWRTTKSTYSLADIHAADDIDEVDGRSASLEILQSEFRQTYSPELALAAYIPLTSVFGSHHMEEHLSNDDLIRKICAQYDRSLYMENDTGEAVESPGTPQENKGDIGSNIAIVGNQLCLQDDVPEPGTSHDTLQLRKHSHNKSILRIDPEKTVCDDINLKKSRHLKGNWLAYWEHELGLNERDTLFNFKQIKLQTFEGHNNSIRSLTCLNNENSFISASKDKTVKLWSIQSFVDGSGRCRYQSSYNRHKKSVFSVAYLESLHLVASCDSTVHVWDPFTNDIVRQLESPIHTPVIALTALPSPSRMVVTATTESTLRFLDMRIARYVHESKCAIGSHGLIRCITTSPDGSWVAVGYSTGVVAVLNLFTGILMGSWKAHDSEILQLKAYNKSSLLSTSFDLHMKLWNVDGGNNSEICTFKGNSEPVHCVSFYKNQLVSATTNNKIGVHTSVSSQASFLSHKLTTEVFKGVLTSMEILPVNRTLLLGADNGIIRLLC